MSDIRNTEIIKDGTEYNLELDEATIKIGGNTEKFVPNINASKWDDETWLNINLPDIVNAEKETFLDDKIELAIGDKVHRFYKKESARGGYNLEYEIQLNTKPISNRVTLDLQHSDDLRFDFQPSLEEEYEKDNLGLNLGYKTVKEFLDDFHQPENAKHSYAVNITKRNNKYKMGKFCHIFRPKIIDAIGKEVWADIEIKDKQLIITINQVWLNSAKYPIIIDPVLGYEATGTNDTGSAVTMWGSTFTSDVAGTIDDFNFSCQANDGNGSKMALYPTSGGTPEGEDVLEQVEWDVLGTGPQGTAAVGTTEIAATTLYFIGWLPENQAAMECGFDTSGGNCEYETAPDPVYADWFPTTLPACQNNSWNFAVWCNYTEAGAPAVGQPYFKRVAGIPHSITYRRW